MRTSKACSCSAWSTGGRETIAGIARDPGFGALLMFGLGGIFVEALQDVVFRIAPIDDVQACDMLHGIRGIKVLRGIRGAPPVDEGALADALCRLGQLAVDFPADRRARRQPVDGV